MGKIKKKYSSGIATNYISRTKAVRKLQLGLNEFRRLCILKGIYPREPRSIKRAGKGSTEPRTYYSVKDISWLMHEPLLQKLRENKAYLRKVKSAREKGEKGKVRRLKRNKPVFQLDHIVKERYPTFEDALHDLDDCLALCHLYATFTHTKSVPRKHIETCRRLCAEFAAFCVMKRSLRAAFVSIKGIYYQVELSGERVIWISPHNFSHQMLAHDVDLRIMSTFADFYVTLLGFVNYRLYQSANLVYPPALSYKREVDPRSVNEGVCELDDFADEMLSSLNTELKLVDRGTPEEPEPIDVIPNAVVPGDSSTEAEPVARSALAEELERAQRERDRVRRQQTLFDGLRFFLNRETPRASLTFVIRCCGGLVSWDAYDGLGSTYSVDDPRITHEVVDRPAGPSDVRRLGRAYVQPQWVYDCLNAAELLPITQYLPGATLPPHLSPFEQKPPTITASTDAMASGSAAAGANSASATADSSSARRPAADDGDSQEANEDENGPAEVDDDDDDGEQMGNARSDEEAETLASQESKAASKEAELLNASGSSVQRKRTANMAVLSGNPEDHNPRAAERARGRAEAAANEQKRMREMLLPKRHRRLYAKIKYAEKARARESRRVQEREAAAAAAGDGSSSA